MNGATPRKGARARRSSNVLTLKQSRYPKEDGDLRPTFKAERIEVPGSPRRVLRAALLADLDATALRAVQGAARVARCPSRVLEPLEAGDVAAARTELRRWLRGSERTDGRLDVDAALWRASERARRCASTYRVYREAGHGLHAVEHRCRARVCQACARRAMRAALGRWRPLFAVPVNQGHTLSFVTLTPASGVAEDGAAVRKFLRSVAKFADMLRRGRPSWGIAPRSWVAGVRALELVPRKVGGFSHAHLVVVRKSYVPFGLHLAKLQDKLRTNESAVTFKDYGMRAAARAAGLGEVIDVKDVTTEHEGEGACAVEAYMGKVEAYMGKVDGKAEERASWDGRSDLQRALRGVRLVEGFGDARGLFGGPDQVTRVRAGVECAPWSLVGSYDPEDPETWDTLPDGSAVVDGPELVVTRRTTYRADTLERWRAWCDVDALRARMRIGEPA